MIPTVSTLQPVSYIEDQRLVSPSAAAYVLAEPHTPAPISALVGDVHAFLDTIFDRLETIGID